VQVKKVTTYRRTLRDFGFLLLYYSAGCRREEEEEEENDDEDVLRRGAAAFHDDGRGSCFPAVFGCGDDNQRAECNRGSRSIPKLQYFQQATERDRSDR